MKSRSVFGNTSSWLLASLDKFCTLGIEAVKKAELQQCPQKLKMHCKKSVKFDLNFAHTPYIEYTDFKAATDPVRSNMNVSNTSAKGRLQICEFIERGPPQKSSRNRPFRQVSGGGP